MLNRFRTLLFLLFVCSFIVWASSVLFYTYGYRFSFERGIFIYTGSLSLKTNMEVATVRIDQELIPNKRLGLLNNSIHIAGLAPGEHFVQVSAPGYKPWEKKVVITSGLTTEFWNIHLVKEHYDRVTIPLTDKTLKMFPAPNGFFAIIRKDAERYSVDVLDIGSNRRTEVFATTEADLLPSLKTNIEWSPESHKLIIPLIKEERLSFSIVDIKSHNTFSLDETAQITTPIRSPRWDATTKDFLFFLSENRLYRFDTRSTEPARIVAEHVAAYDLSGNKLYYLRSDSGLVYEINGNGNDGSPTAITTVPVATGKEGVYSLIIYDETRLSLIEEKTGKLLVYNEEAAATFRELGTTVQGIQYSDDGKKLLFFTETEISIYFNQDWTTQPFRARDSIVQVARLSAPIKNVQWSEDYEHVIFSLGKNIKLIELDNRDRRGLTDLVVLETPPSQLLSRFGSDLLYIVLENSSGATDNNTVLSIELPQYATFFSR